VYVTLCVSVCGAVRVCPALVAVEDELLGLCVSLCGKLFASCCGARAVSMEHSC